MFVLTSACKPQPVSIDGWWFVKEIRTTAENRLVLKDLPLQNPLLIDAEHLEITFPGKTESTTVKYRIQLMGSQTILTIYTDDSIYGGEFTVSKLAQGGLLFENNDYRIYLSSSPYK